MTHVPQVVKHFLVPALVGHCVLLALFFLKALSELHHWESLKPLNLQSDVVRLVLYPFVLGPLQPCCFIRCIIADVYSCLIHQALVSLPSLHFAGVCQVLLEISSNGPISFSLHFLQLKFIFAVEYFIAMWGVKWKVMLLPVDIQCVALCA